MLVLVYPQRRLGNTATCGLGLAALLARFAPADSAPAVTAVIAGFVAAAASASAARAPAALRAPLIAAAVAAVTIAAAAGLAAAHLGPSTDVLVAYDLVLMATAVGLLGSLATGRWRAAAASGLVVELGGAPAGAPVTARLAEALRDPGLELRVRLPGGPWTDEAGRPALAPDAPDRAVIRRTLDDGTELVLLHDPAAIADRAAAESALAVAATAVDNARRDSEVQAHIEHLHRLRRGLLDAADEERRQLEYELRSGPLRELNDLDNLLGELPSERVAALRSELVLARGELVEFAQGLYPEALLESGLSVSLRAAAARSPVPVAIDADLDDAALPVAVALTAYFVASEALANVVKHAQAHQARLELSASAGELLVRVIDDGVGRADPAGAGLSGLCDRVQAIDGELEIRSPAGGGTVLEARLPWVGS